MYSVLVPVIVNTHTALQRGFGSSSRVRAMCREHFQRLAEANYNDADQPSNMPISIQPIWFDTFVWTGWIHFTFEGEHAWRAFSHFVHQSDNTELQRTDHAGVTQTVYAWETQLYELDVDRARKGTEPAARAGVSADNAIILTDDEQA